MEISPINVIFTVLSLIALAVPGFILSKCNMLGEKASSTISNLVLYVCQPAMVIMGFQGEKYSSDIAINMLIVAGLTLAVHLIMTAIMFIFVRNKDNNAKINCLRIASIFGNCGFMGFPMIQSLFSGGEFEGQAVIYCAVVIAVFNILSWTLGVYVLTKDKKNISVKKILLNPTIISVVVGLIIFVIAKVPLRELCAEGSNGDIIITKIFNSVDMLGDAVTPLAMIVIGINLAKANVKQVFLDKTAYLCCFYKLIVATLVSILLVTFLPVSPVIKYVLFFLMSVPSAASAALFAVKYDCDPNSASIMVLLTSILSMATIPLMYIFYTAVFGSFLVL